MAPMPQGVMMRDRRARRLIGIAVAHEDNAGTATGNDQTFMSTVVAFPEPLARKHGGTAS